MPQIPTRRNDPRQSQWPLLALLSLLLAVSACQKPATPPPATDPAPVEPAKPAETPETTQVPEPEPPAPEPPAPEPFRFAIVTSCDNPDYAAVKKELIALAGDSNVDVFELDKSAARAKAAIDSLRERGHDNVVAIGLMAARATKRLDAEKVVFCQVMNYQDFDLLGPKRRGVHALPPLDGAAELWQAIAPNLTRVGVISGAGHDAAIAAAKKAFAAHGIELVHRVVASDKETLLEFQRMLPDIQGYWLLPDNRVLSRTTLRDLMSLARRSGAGILANDARFLDLGASLSAAAGPSSIAAEVYALLLGARDRIDFAGRGMVVPGECLLNINASVADALGYDSKAAPRRLLAR